MTFVATPNPNDTPPSVELDYALDDPGSITSYEVTRNGETLRFNTVPSGDQIILTDYEAAYGVLLVYVITGTFLPAVTPDWTETWASLAAWTGSGFSASGGKAVSTTLGAQIVRSASGTIQKVEVDDPDYVRIELLTAADVVVASVAVASNVTLTGTSAASTAGSGSFVLTLADGTVTAVALDNSWALSRSYTGVPTKVRVVSLYPTVAPDITWAASDIADMAVDAAGFLYVADETSPHQIRKFDPSGVEVVGGGFPFSTTGQPSGVALDAAGFIYVTDMSNDVVRKFTSTGVEIVTGGFPIATSDAPQDLTVDSAGNIYVLDSLNNLVRKYNSSGVAGITWSTVTFSLSIAVDSANNIYTMDIINKLIRKFTSAGVAGITFSTTGTPEDLFINSANTVYVADRTNKLIRTYTTAGVAGITFSTVGLPLSVGADSTGTVYVFDVTNELIRKFAAQTASTDDIVVTLVTTEETFSESTNTQLDAEDAWLIHPFNTDLSLNIGRDTGCASEGIEVSPETKRTSVAQTRSVLLNPVGRRRWVAITQQDRMIATWDLVLLTESYADRDAIVNFLAADVPFLFRSPAGFGWDLPDDWYSVGDVPDNRETYQLGALPCGHPYNKLTLPLYPVDPSSEPVPPSWTYGQDYLAYETYADSLAAQPTYLDRLVGPSS